VGAGKLGNLARIDSSLGRRLMPFHQYSFERELGIGRLRVEREREIACA
jgi:hypothetical protein